jgi:hypothetical protein
MRCMAEMPCMAEGGLHGGGRRTRCPASRAQCQRAQRQVQARQGCHFSWQASGAIAPVYAGRFDPITDRSGCGPFCRRHRPANKPGKHRAARRKRRTTSILRLRPQGHCNGLHCSASARAGRRRRHGESDQGPLRSPRRTEANRRKTSSMRRKPGTPERFPTRLNRKRSWFSLILRMILSEKSATFRDHALGQRPASSRLCPS